MEVQRAEASQRRRERIRAPEPSPFWMRLFSRYVPGYIRRHFHAMRLACDGRPRENLNGPLIVCLNHPSWWDPLMCVVLANRFFPERRHFAPIDARALQRYGFFRRLGFFGIEMESRAGAAEFLRMGTAILADPNATLWVTAGGQFTDARERPVRLRPGVAHLARRLDRGGILPLAVEYPFWQERTPEALALFGEPIRLEGAAPAAAAKWNRRIEAALERAQDDLAALAKAQDGTAFDTLIGGRAGVGFAYDAWRRMRAVWRREHFQPGHGE